jgi:hypothetical protein
MSSETNPGARSSTKITNALTEVGIPYAYRTFLPTSQQGEPAAAWGAEPARELAVAAAA